eukprot:TRINITY_DN3277_c0_g2_i3.p1 TRINITY_DN3277_c0_g2~~TRINITY_DN3277_c0_g2_i3.p1  ORF type:complete len:195 (-),score=29.45 TRINITY_DN3277_c0_g2_i3:316-900(-)
MCIRDSINAEYGNRIRIARRLWEADHSLPPISKKRARSMSDDAPNTGPGKTEIPPVDGCGIFTTSVEEGQSKMEAPKEDQGVPSSGGEGGEPDCTNSTAVSPKLPAQGSPASVASPPGDSPGKKSKKKKEGRCPVEGCRKKIGLTGFHCRCGSTFCALHRYSDAHECDFDYKALARSQISAANPVIEPAKFDKI